jgi:Caspase domain/Effector-associated domain 11/Leucine rich repeat
MTTAESKIEAFAKQAHIEEAHKALARLTAFPIGVTVDMVYQLWYNFKDRIEGIPMIGVSDVLLSPLFRLVGNGIYEMEKDTRTLLLDELRAQNTEGGVKLEELAYFIQAYAINRLTGERYASFRETLLMNAQATLKPEDALKNLIQRLQKSQKDSNRSEVLRLRELLEQFAIQEKGRGEVQDSTFYPLLQYSIALKGAFINAPDVQIRQKFDGFKDIPYAISISTEKTTDGQMLQLPASLVSKGILQKLNITKDPKLETKQHIRALIVGVNSYTKPYPQLKGAINDGEKMSDWLQQQFGTDKSDKAVQIVSLFDKTATKDTILEAFRQQAECANEHDFVFFHFSGYGEEIEEIQQREGGNTEGSFAYFKKKLQENSDDRIIDALLEWVNANNNDNSELRQEIFSLKNRYSTLIKNETIGVISRDEALVERARIKKVTHSIIDEIKEPDNTIKVKYSALLPFDAARKENKLQKGILGQDLLEIVRQYPKVNFVFSLDGCYCHGLFREIESNMVALINYKEEEMGYEMPFKEGIHGVFTYHALSVLMRYPNISYLQLINTINEDVIANSAVKPQTALLQCHEINKHKIIFKDNFESDDTLPMVHALLVGINDYPNQAHRLNGCINDCELISEFFQESMTEQIIVNKLYNDRATKVNIIDGINDIVGKAKVNDFIVIMLSGHHSQVKEEKTFVAYESREKEGKDILESEVSLIVERNPHLNFVFLQSMRFIKLHNNLLSIICGDDVEMDINGKRNSVFVYSLVKALKNNKDISYEELRNVSQKEISKFVKKFNVVVQCIEGNEKKRFLKDTLLADFQTENKKVLDIIHQNKIEKAEKLDLTGLLLNHIPSQVFELTHLKTLDLFENFITEIPNGINKLTQLEKLLISKNKISRLPDVLKHLKHLKIIKLDDNQIERYPSVLNDIQSLEDISLEGNKIRVVPSEVAQMPNLRLFDIKENPVMNISREKLKFLKNDLTNLFAYIKKPEKNNVPVMVILANDDAFDVVNNSLKPVVDSKQLQIIRLTGRPTEWYRQIKPYERNITLLHIMFLGGKGDYEQYFTLDNDDKNKMNIAQFLPFLGKPEHLRLCMLSFNKSKDYEKAVLNYGFDCCISVPNTLLDKDANDFLGRFYTEITNGCTIEEAYKIVENKLKEKTREYGNS